MTEYTKIPFNCLNDLNGLQSFNHRRMYKLIEDSNGAIIALIPYDTEINRETVKANAEFIVKACNSHDALVNACKGIMDMLILPCKNNSMLMLSTEKVLKVKQALDGVGVAHV